jgi:4'-phosphopantetheinyl transferase EntD
VQVLPSSFKRDIILTKLEAFLFSYLSFVDKKCTFKNYYKQAIGRFCDAALLFKEEKKNSYEKHQSVLLRI